MRRCTQLSPAERTRALVKIVSGRSVPSVSVCTTHPFVAPDSRSATAREISSLLRLAGVERLTTGFIPIRVNPDYFRTQYYTPIPLCHLPGKFTLDLSL